MVALKGNIEWSIEDLSSSLKIGPTDVKEYFTDGRRISFILERRIAREVLRGTLAMSEGAGYDLVDSKGGQWEVRSISSGGVYFCPSYMVGSGRHFEESGFLTKLKEIEGYILCDIERFPKVPFWIISKEIVETWCKDGKLGAITKIPREKALQLLKLLP